MDYEKLLGRSTQLVLPYVGGTRVSASDRRLRVDPRPASEGWWRFEIRGRKARPLEAADAPDLSERPALRGHLAGGWLFLSGGRAARMHLMPDADPEPLSPATARRWHDGSLLFEGFEFDDDAELAARDRLERRDALDGVAGVVPSLRAAYGYTLLVGASAQHAVPVTVSEGLARLPAIASGGVPAARLFLEELAERRQEEAERLAALQTQRRTTPPRQAAPPPPRRDSLDQRVERALDNTDASLVRLRRLGDDNAEVHFDFMGERFISVVEAGSLRVIDSGICLSGEDRECNLDSLPGVIREAIDSDALYITRH